MKKNKTNILCTPDDNYIPYCGIMLTSLFENNKDLDIDVYLICSKLNNKNKEDIKLLCDKYNVGLHFIFVNNELFKECPIKDKDHISIAAYYRLIVQDVLPQKLEKILYFDCDIIINGSIKNLYNEDIEKYAIGAVLDEGFYCEKKYKRLCYDKKYSYINSGVVLFNLNYWRKNNITEKCLSFIKKYPERVLFHDQDTLNGILYNQMKLLPIQYNLQTGFLYECLTKYFKEKLDEITDATKNAIVIHYTGVEKPWIKGVRHPYRAQFIHYRKISLWRKYPMQKNKTPKSIKDIAKEILQWLGLKKRPRIFITEQ